MKGNLIVISAPSGAGKTSLVNGLLAQLPGMRVSVSHTTRPSRQGEIEGVSYHFTDHASFERMIETGAMLEHARVYDHYYGTSQHWVDAELKAGTDVILEIDWQGARQVRQLRPDACFIFILPPSRAELEARLNRRGQDAPEVIARRMAKAIDEISHYVEYDYLVVNDVFEDALAGLAAIVRARRLTIDLQGERLEPLLRGLMA